VSITDSNPMHTGVRNAMDSKRKIARGKPEISAIDKQKNVSDIARFNKFYTDSKTELITNTFNNE
jgi:hypothetical protein